MANGLEAQPLSNQGQFNWVFLIWILVTGILSLFFLFYFNRLFATAVSYGIRAYTWYRFKAYIDISALQISLLGGRVFFKSIRYHAHNVTVYVYEGHITWRYWLPRVQEAEVFQEDHVVPRKKQRSSSTAASEKDDRGSNDEKPRARSNSIGKEEKAGGKPKKELPCRISVKVTGVEAFIYNRSPLYDTVVEATMNKAKEAAKHGNSKENLGKSQTSSSQGSKSQSHSKASPVPQKVQTRTTIASATAPEKPQIPAFLRIFPIKVECKRAAAALGNENTTNVLTAKAERAVGTVDAGHAGPLDLWKLLFAFSIEKVKVAMRPNKDFKEFQLDAGQRLLREKELAPPEPEKKPVKEAVQKTRGLWHRLRYLFHRHSSAESLRTASVKSGTVGHQPPKEQLPGQCQWHGLTRYLEDRELNEHEEWQKVEYAKVSDLVDCDRVTMRFYWDMSGPVPDGTLDSDTLLGSNYEDDINGMAPPEYGMDLGVYGGFVQYGPWADRQRINLQQIFFPAPYVDAVPAKPLKSGELRVCTVFKIKVIVEEDVVLRVPAREESKDAKWKGRADKAQPAYGSGATTGKGSRHWRKHKRKNKQTQAAIDARPFGWLDITVKKDSVVNYTMDMFPRPAGYRNNLDLDVKGVEMQSSVNHGLLWRSGPVSVQADISQPIEWNTLRKWPFDIVINDMELFILRDHLFLIIDLVNDWSSGAPSDFWTFVPYNYQLEMTFKNFVMYLNVNDANIINDPADFDRNDFLTIEGQLHAILGIPMENYRPKSNKISFDVLAQNLSMRQFSPPKSTFSVYVEDKTMATLPKLTLNGSYTANQEAKVGNVDVLRMDIVGTGLSLKAFGFYVRQLVSIKENYFGDYMHFKTLEEFQAASDDLEEANAKTASFPKPTSINELDVILCIVAEEATVMFPTNLYSCKEFVRAELPRADLDLRIVSYYLDMGLQLSPISILTGVSATKDEDDDDPVDTESSTQFWVAHVDLNGHRAFGLPPNEDAYVSQWDIDIGKISGEMSSKFVRDLALAGRAFAFSIQDAENALPVTSPAVALDASFVQVRTNTVRLWMHVGKDALLIDLNPVTVDVSDWASSLFSQRVNVLVPMITFACVDGRSASRHRSPFVKKKPVRTYAFLQTGVSIDVVGRKLHFEMETKKQQAHFRLHDQRTGRFPFLIRPDIDAPIKPEDELLFEPPAMPYPPMPEPLVYGKNRSLSIKSSRSTGSSLGSKSSNTSISGSIRKGRPLSTTAQRSELLGVTTDVSGSRPSTSFHSVGASSSSSSIDSFRGGNERLPNDAERAKFGLPASTMAFSSPYSEPYFPLEMTAPDETNVPEFPKSTDRDDSSVKSTISQIIDDPETDYNAEHVSVMIKVMPGLRVFVEPHLAITVSKLLERVLPRNPEEVMDSFHMSVMGAISSHNAERTGPASILEISASIPSAHMRVVALEEHKDEIADQIDIMLSSLELTVRARTHPRDSGAVQYLALHTLLGNLNLSVSQKSGRELVKPAVSLHVDDVLVWLALTSTHAFHVSLRDSTVSVNGPQATYLTNLALKLVPLITGIMERFDDILTNDTRRLQWLTYVLTQNGEIVSDPPFMARMLYILRAFPGHFRNTDSWKILSRFRNILMHLPKEKADELETHCKENRLNCPADAPEKTLESWTQWRNWDVPYVNQTMAFKMLWRPDELKQESSPEKPPFTVTFRSESLRIALESVKTSSEIVIEETSLGVENIPPTRPEGLMLVDENMRTETLIQLHMGIFALNLDWELLEIAEDVIALNDKIQQVSSKLQAGGNRTTRQAIDDGLARHDVHIVLSTDTGSITLQSINVRHVSQAEGLKVSIIGTTQASEQLGQCVSAIINVDRAITELHGTNSRIWQTLLISPSLYVDRLQPAPGADFPATITLALAYEDLQIRVTEQVPGILHLIDLIILDEVAKCQRLAEIVQPRPSSSARASPALKQQKLKQHKTKTTVASETTIGSVPPKLHMAVLAGNIHLEVSLLQNLGYMLEGVAASVRVAPSLTKDKIFSIDFDVGKQKHAFVNTSGEERHIQGLLDVPPINGHVGLELGHDETSVSVATTIERVEVDAGAIQGVIGVVNQPEVQDVFKSIKAGLEDIQHHVEHVFPKNELQEPKPVKEQRILFDARLALLGIRVSADTPTAKDAHRYRATAEVELGIGPLHATASNRGTSKDANPLIPEVRAHIQDIGAALRVKERGKIRRCGNATMSIRLHFNNNIGENGVVHRELKVRSDGIEINANPETASTVVDVINHLEDRIKRLDLSKEVEYLRKLRDERRHTVIKRIKGGEGWTDDDEMPFSPEDLLSITTTIELTDIQAAWLVDSSFAARRGAPVDDLVFSIQSIEFKTRGGHEARLNIQNIRLQLAKRKESKQYRALNSALLPEVGFSVVYWSEKGKNVKLAFKATGKPLDLRLESKFMLPVSAVQKSIERARDKFKTGTATWQSMPTTSGAPRKPSFDTKRLSSVLVEADFAGAQVYIQGSGPRSNSLASIAAASQQHGSQHGRYGQFAADGALMQTTLTAPGISFKMEYNRDDVQPRLNGELMIDASSNMLAPNVVPLVLEISNSIKEVVRSQDAKTKPQTPPKPDTTEDERPSSDQSRAKQFFEDDNIVATTPAKIFGKTKVDLGFRIAKQEFGFSCQPIARVDAKASLEDFYITMNTIDSDEHGHFFAMSAVMTKLTAQVKHMYSREPTFSYDMDSIVLSAMNNKHLSGTAGISAILNVNPTKIVINGKQFQDLLLFREIWVPPEIRKPSAASPAQAAAPATTVQRPDEFVVQKYQTFAAAAAFPWNATVNIAELVVDLDLGQSIGKSSFRIINLWASQQKSSNWEQNLCIGLDEMGVDSTGRMSGFIHLGKLGVRTSINWPEESTQATLRKTPLIQASIGFKELKAKAAFDYQAFAFGDIGNFEFLMYNVREKHGTGDRLVAVLDCEKAYVFCTSSSPSQAVALYQAFDRLIQEKQTAYMQSLKDIEKHLRRESTVVPTRFGPEIADSPVVERKSEKSPISLHTDVVVTMGGICFGVYPSTFFDSQMLKLEASDIQARFAVGLEGGRITSGLGMTLGQLQVALSSVRRITTVPKALEISADEVINSALNAKGGIILRVPKVVASMQTWQPPKGYDVDYIFKSLFDGKIDVGWNLSRINFIKGMWEYGYRALASRLDKSLPESAVKIKAEGPAADSPSPPSSSGGKDSASQPQEKITAEINLPQSRYEYHALEPPVIETPQLRDMGEATPPLEWVGLHRDRLPNVTHQIIIVTLLEVCKEVEDAYGKILGGAVREAAC